LYSVPVENEVTIHKRSFDASQAICSYFGTFERVRQSMIKRVHACFDLGRGHFKYFACELWLYRGADELLARPGRKQATASEDFDIHISYL